MGKMIDKELAFFILGIATCIGLYLVGMTAYGFVKITNAIFIKEGQEPLKRTLEPPHTAKGQV